MEALQLSRELEGKNQAKPDIVVAILWIVVIPIDRAAVHRMVDPAAATENTVRTLLTMTLVRGGKKINLPFSVQLVGADLRVCPA